MTIISSKFKLIKMGKKIIFFVIAFIIAIGGITVINQKTGFFSTIGNNIVLGIGNIFLSNKFFTPTVVGAQVTGPYQDIQGNVAISGNVGIGTTSPLAKLDVQAVNDNYAYLGGPIDGRTIKIGTDASGYSQIQGIVRNTGAARDITLQNSGGNVGIGTTGPTGSLHVVAPAGAKALKVVSNNQYEVGQFIGPSYPSLLLTYNGGGTSYISNYNNLGLAFGADSATWNTVDMIILNNGNVGIGTASPTNKLDVAGDVSLNSKHAFRSTDSWLKLNQDSAFTSGTHTPGLFAPGALNVGGANGWGNPGGGNVWIAGTTTLYNTLTQSGGYAYLGNYNSSSIRPRSGNDLAVGWNFDGGQRDISLWNTDINNTGGTSFRFRQLTSASSHKDLVTILPNGGLGIGTTPSTAWPLALRNLSTTAGKQWYFGPDANNNVALYNQNGTGVYILDGGTGWNANSDQRLKTNIQTLSSEKGLAAIVKLNPVSFNWIDTKSLITTQLGFIAQQVQGVFPELVSSGPDTTITRPDGSTQKVASPLGLNYTGFIPSLIKAVQELNQNSLTLSEKVQKQEEQIKIQQKEIDALKQEIEQLKSR